MNPREILELADELSTGDKEAQWRAAISRAYFAAFRVARQLLLKLGFRVPLDEQAHRYLWKRLANCGHIDVIRAGNNLSWLRKQRNWADYDLERPLNQATAMDEVLNADQIVELLENVTSSAATGAITHAIKDYERDVLREVTWQS
jgi:uncharacterized protein (UPF0332 family)